MRRWVAVGALGLALASVGACGRTTGGSAAPSAAATSSSVPANTDEVCANFEKAFDATRMQALGVPIGELIAARAANDAAKIKEAENKVAGELTRLAGEVTEVGAAATDPSVKAQFGQVAANITKSAQDLAFLATVRSVADLEQQLGGVLQAWVSPIVLTCDLDS